MNARISTGHRPTGAFLMVAVLVLSGCSLVTKDSRPDPTAENVRCALEYRPNSGEPSNDLLFLAWSRPYRGENFYMSLPDNLLHMAAAPGRHLRKDARVEGATCTGRAWRRGFRLPGKPSSKKWLLCKRMGLEPVVFEVETKWGVCTQRIAAGDPAPRGLGGLGNVISLSSLAQQNGS